MRPATPRRSTSILLKTTIPRPHINKCITINNHRTAAAAAAIRARPTVSNILLLATLTNTAITRPNRILPIMATMVLRPVIHPHLLLQMAARCTKAKTRLIKDTIHPPTVAHPLRLPNPKPSAMARPKDTASSTLVAQEKERPL